MCVCVSMCWVWIVCVDDVFCCCSLTSSSSSSTSSYRTTTSTSTTSWTCKRRCISIKSQTILDKKNYLPSFFLAFALGVSSINNVSSGKLSGKITHRILLPRMLSESRLVGSRFLTVILTVFKCVFMLISTPKVYIKVNPLSSNTFLYTYQ